MVSDFLGTSFSIKENSKKPKNEGGWLWMFTHL